jgi:hypothetical protein
MPYLVEIIAISGDYDGLSYDGLSRYAQFGFPFNSVFTA